MFSNVEDLIVFVTDREKVPSPKVSKDQTLQSLNKQVYLSLEGIYFCISLHCTVIFVLVLTHVQVKRTLKLTVGLT